MASTYVNRSTCHPRPDATATTRGRLLEICRPVACDWSFPHLTEAFSWSTTCQEAKARTLTQDIPEIVKSIEREVAPMIEKMQEAERQKEVWRLEDDRRRRCP